MAPHQKHYREKMVARGWMDRNRQAEVDGDEKERHEMARGLLGLELVSNVDYWTMLAQDDLFNTFNAPWADEERWKAQVSRNLDEAPEYVREKVQQAIRCREILATLTDDQREVVDELIQKTTKGLLFSFCCSLDQCLKSKLTIHLNETPADDDPPILVHPGDLIFMTSREDGWTTSASFLDWKMGRKKVVEMAGNAPA